MYGYNSTWLELSIFAFVDCKKTIKIYRKYTMDGNKQDVLPKLKSKVTYKYIK